MYTIGIDLGGTRVKIGLLHSGKIIEQKEIKAYSDKGLKERLPFIEKQINHLLHKNKVSDFIGIGVSIPGIVDVTQAKLLTINDKYTDAQDINLKAWAQRIWGKPLFMENDARCALVGEWQYGAGKHYDNVVMMTLGTGIGTSAVVEGKVIRGDHFQAGILGGHFIINYNGLACNCGNIGCAEAEASTWNLDRIVESLLPNQKKWENKKIDFAFLFSAYKNGDQEAIKVIDHCIRIWSIAITNLVYAYDPEVVIIGGGIMRSAEVILPKIKENLSHMGWVNFDKIQIVPAQFVHASALLSAEYFLKPYRQTAKC